jgi:chorismate mutase
MEVVGIRGAIIARDNTAEAIGDATARLVSAILSENSLERSRIISMFFTMTPDLNAAFPAAAAREVCGPRVPLLCATEIAVPDGLERVIRVLVHAYYPPERGDVTHVYMDGAQALRPDLKTGGGKQ